MQTRAVKALIVAIAFLEAELEKLRDAVSPGNARARRVIGRIVRHPSIQKMAPVKGPSPSHLVRHGLLRHVVMVVVMIVVMNVPVHLGLVHAFLHHRFVLRRRLVLCDCRGCHCDRGQAAKT
jgi:hypothetical protein